MLNFKKLKMWNSLKKHNRKVIKVKKEIIEKLSQEIEEKEKLCDIKYTELGKKYFIEYVNGLGADSVDCIELIEEIKNINLEINIILEKIKKVDSGLLCPNCGAELKDGMKFCYNCGIKLFEELEEPENEPEEITNRICPNCGSELIDGAMFCGECGTKID